MVRGWESNTWPLAWAYGRPAFCASRNTGSVNRGKILSAAPKLALTRNKVVERAVDRAQAEGHPRVRKQGQQVLARSVLLRDHDLVENELQVGPDEMDAGAAASRILPAAAPAGGAADARRDRSGRRREHRLQHAVGVLIDGLDAQRQAGEIRRSLGRSVRWHSRRRPPPKVPMSSNTPEPGHDFHLPVVGDGSGNGSGRIVGADIVRIGHAGERYPQ